MLVKDLDKLKFIEIKETETGFDIYSFGHYALRALVKMTFQ